MKRKHLLIGCALSFLLGVFVFDIFRSDLLFGLLFLIPGLLLIPRIPIRITLSWGLCFAAGILRVFWGIHNISPNEVAFYGSEEKESAPAAIVGTVMEFPNVRSKKTQVYLDVALLQIDTKILTNISGKALVNIPKYPTIRYGDILHVTGELRVPPVWEDFSYKRFLEKEGTHAYIPWGEFEIISKNHGNPLFQKLFSLRNAIETSLRQKIPEPEASFAVGILLGGERGFPPEIIEEFRATGLSHLLALSGFNITILIIFVFWMFQIFPKRFSIMSTFAFVIGFVLLTGASASVVRAAVMGLIALFVLHSGHEGRPLYVLMWSVVLIVLWNPFLLLSDISFQLSAAAVVGLILFIPLWERFFMYISGVFGFREALQTTLAAQITAVPLVAFYFQRISLISPVANLLVAPLIPLAMLFSVLSFIPIIGHIFAFCAYTILKFGLFLAHIFSQIPMADIAFSLGIMGLLLIYAGIGIIWYWYDKKRTQNT